jgi:hypothetical protein
MCITTEAFSRYAAAIEAKERQIHGIDEAEGGEGGEGGEG